MTGMSNAKIPNFDLENKLVEGGFSSVCGIDEAGRGAWAGPLVSAAVVLDSKNIIDGINDSKKLSPSAREALSRLIKKYAVSFGIGIVSVEEINSLGVQSATYVSYHRAIKRLSPAPDFILIDHYRLPNPPAHQKSISHGDQISFSIAAASILAKVERDKIMLKIAKNSPVNYNFEKNFGYGTADHIKAINEFGLCHDHRTKFVNNLMVKKHQRGLFDNYE